MCNCIHNKSCDFPECINPDRFEAPERESCAECGAKYYDDGTIEHYSVCSQSED